MNATCCMDTEEEDKGCVKVVQCDGMDDFADEWRTPYASWSDMEGANEGEVPIITVMKAGEESPPNASQMGKKSGKKYVAGGKYVTECLTEEEECVLWRKQYDLS